MNDIRLMNDFSEVEQLAFMDKIYELLSLQATKYLSGDSTSIPVETAEKILQSIIFTLRFALAKAGKSEKILLTGDLEKILRNGQSLLEEKLTKTRKLWEHVCLTAPNIQNVYLKETLSDYKTFFKRYDLRYFAHQIPCSIIYPLCNTVTEEKLGVLYVEEWLHRILIENWILNQFDNQAVIRLLSKTCGDYSDFYINLCEQPVLNSVGLAMLKRSVFSLKLSGEDLRKLENLLFSCDDIKAELNRAVVQVTAELNAPQKVENYIKTFIDNTFPRIKSAEKYGNLSGIFIAE